MAKRTLKELILAIDNAIEICDDVAHASNGDMIFNKLLAEIVRRHGQSTAIAWGLILSGMAFNQYFLGKIPEAEIQGIRIRLKELMATLLEATRPAEGSG